MQADTTKTPWGSAPHPGNSPKITQEEVTILLTLLARGIGEIQQRRAENHAIYAEGERSAHGMTIRDIALRKQEATMRGLVAKLNPPD